MPSFRYGGKKGKKCSLTESARHVILRTQDRGRLDPNMLSKKAWSLLDKLELNFQLPGSGVEVHHIRAKRGIKKICTQVRNAFKTQTDIEFAGRVLVDRKSKVPVIYTENLFVTFRADQSQRSCIRLLRNYELSIKRKVSYTDNGYFVSAPKGCGQNVFSIAEELLQEDAVEYCHPELIRQVQRRGAFPEQWHLKPTTISGHRISAHSHIAKAWQITEGKGITIAVIDDGFDLTHEEFSGRYKIVHPWDATRKVEDPRPGSRDNHGTPCAGVACANGQHGASGVAPQARLMPIRLDSGSGSQDEAEALVWAADHGADIISCSWGPGDADWRNAEDPKRKTEHLLPDSTRLALEYVTQKGRGGKGCVVTWAAGNGNESVDKDGYASNERVMAIAACNDHSTRSVYSDFGKAIWCCFPSKDYASTARTRGIWTTDRSGPAGYNPGRSRLGDRLGSYTNRFGGTSSSCPGVAGIAALVLSVNPHLTWKDVKDVIKDSSDKIDQAHGHYDASGHSRWYGYGRANAQKAVKLAQKR
ncbi:MAG: peptidase S8 [Nitrospirales bacterium]|nr:MAG: peptidase S8 [Nitrospirales bacterium]